MPDQVSADDLANTAPDPEQDFDGFVDAVASRVVDELKDLQTSLPPKHFREVLILRSMKRLENAITSGWPPSLIAYFAGNLVRNIGRWSEINESPDGSR